MLVLKENEVCPHANQCPHNEMNNCYGARAGRNNIFTCEFIDNNGNILTNRVRLSEDKTGKMKVIME